MTKTLEKMGAVIEARVRAAGAIYDYDGVEIARAALQAIRGENEELDRVVSRAAWHSGSGQNARNIRTAMIDAILNEKP